MMEPSSDQDLSRITAALTLTGSAVDLAHLEPFRLPEPSHVGRRGDPQRGKLPPLRENYWSVEVEGRFDSIEKALEQLLDRVEPFREQIINAISVTGAEAGFLVSVSIDKDRPVYCLSASLLQRLSSFSLELCLDIFDYST